MEYETPDKISNWYEFDIGIPVSCFEDPNVTFQIIAARTGKTVYEFDPSSLKRKNGADFREGIQKLFPSFRCHYIDTAIKDEEEKFWFIGDDSYVLAKQTKESIETFFITFDKEKYLKYMEFHKENTQEYEEDSVAPVYIIGAGSGGLRLQYLGDAASLSSTKGLIVENYDPEVVEKYEYIKEQFNSPKPQGRIAILYGAAGSGKTYFIRSLVSELNKNVKTVFVAAENFSSLNRPEFASMLIEEKDEDSSYLLVLEDSDSILCSGKRGADNMHSISSLLNFSDGILGGILDIKLILTTNSEMEEIDSAVIRPGRLLEIVNIEPRNVDDAIKIYKRITSSEDVDTKLLTKQQYTLAEIYELASKEIKNVRKIKLPSRKGNMGF